MFDTAQKMKFSIKDFISKCDQIRWKLRIWSYLLKNSLMENFIFCAVRLVSRTPLHGYSSSVYLYSKCILIFNSAQAHITYQLLETDYLIQDYTLPNNCYFIDVDVYLNKY